MPENKGSVNQKGRMRLGREDAEAIAWLREWVAEGFPKRIDGSFPVDFLTVIRRLGRVPSAVSSRLLEECLIAGPGFDHRMPHAARKRTLLIRYIVIEDWGYDGMWVNADEVQPSYATRDDAIEGAKARGIISPKGRRNDAVIVAIEVPE